MKTLLALVSLPLALVPAGGIGPLASPRAAHTATLLLSGEVLIAGGCSVNGCELDGRERTTELYDPRTGRFREGPRLRHGRVGHAAVRLREGSVLVVGGYEATQATATAEPTSRDAGSRACRRCRRRAAASRRRSFPTGGS